MGPKPPVAVHESDLNVEPISAALDGWHLDLVITGSIGSVEAVRLLRALRRLGASTRACATAGALEFITAKSLTWACGGHPVLHSLSGSAEHISTGDACVVAPASANFIAKISHGICDDPASTLVHSCIGRGRPLILFPAMHESLAANPFYQENLARLAALPNVMVMSSRNEEGKRKVPDPATAADEIAHGLRRERAEADRWGMIIVYGGAQAAVDDVRHIGNFSTGALGAELAAEAFRRGYETHLVEGITSVPRPACSSVRRAASNEEFKAAAQGLLASKPFGLVMMAALLDFIPSDKQTGKIASGGRATLSLELRAAEKVISQLQPQLPLKVGFKLESPLDTTRLPDLWLQKGAPYGLSLLMANDLGSVGDAAAHTAFALGPNGPTNSGAHQDYRRAVGKKAIADLIIQHFDRFYLEKSMAGEPPANRK